MNIFANGTYLQRMLNHQMGNICDAYMIWRAGFGADEPQRCPNHVIGRSLGVVSERREVEGGRTALEAASAAAFWW